MESDCIIMSLIYVERLLKQTKGGIRLTYKNWKSVVFSSMVMSSKVWDDLSMWNADFSQVCSSFTLQRINELELAMLDALRYDVKVKASEYAKVRRGRHSVTKQQSSEDVLAAATSQ
jgi:hypothetical protein